VVLIRILALLLEWEQIYRTSKLEMLMNWCSFLEARIQEPMRITNVEATGGGREGGERELNKILFKNQCMF
jgi:hypothetical protein